MIIIAYHRNCTDGFVAAALAHKKLTDDDHVVMSVPVEYGKAADKLMEIIAPEIDTRPQDYNPAAYRYDSHGCFQLVVVAVDFSFSEAELKRLERVKIVILDHHADAVTMYTQPALLDYIRARDAGVVALFSSEHSGASIVHSLPSLTETVEFLMEHDCNFVAVDNEYLLQVGTGSDSGTWQYMPLFEIAAFDAMLWGAPAIVAYAHDYDTWQHRLSGSKAFEAGLRLVYDYDSVGAGTYDDIEGCLDHILHCGETVLEYNRRQWSKLPRSNRTTLLVDGRELVVDLYDCPAAWLNELADYLNKKDDAPDTVIGYRIGSNQVVSLSCRSANDTANTVASYFGGKGHANSAGAKTTLAKLFELISVVS